MDQRVYLKIKIKSLAEETRIIRKEEKKKGPFREGLYLHRIGVVRTEARATLLAYNFIRGVPYNATEPNTTQPFYNIDKVKAMVKRYGKMPESLKSSEWTMEKDEELKRLEEWFKVK
jgi:hypothetical protein